MIIGLEIHKYSSIQHAHELFIIVHFLKEQTIISPILLRPCEHWQYSAFGQNREILLYYHPDVKETYIQKHGAFSLAHLLYKQVKCVPLQTTASSIWFNLKI